VFVYVCERESFPSKTIIKKRSFDSGKRERESERTFPLCVCRREKRYKRRLLFIIVEDLVVVTDCFLRQKEKGRDLDREQERAKVGAEEKKIIKTLSQPKITFFVFFCLSFYRIED
jgi:hypothetical protein